MPGANRERTIRTVERLEKEFAQRRNFLGQRLRVKRHGAILGMQMRGNSGRAKRHQASFKHSAPRSRGAMRPRFAGNLALPKKEGAGKTGCALHPRSRVQYVQRTRTRAYRFSGNTPAFPAQWFYGLYRALPGDRLSCHRRPQEALAPCELDASVAASGPHDFAVRVSHARQSQHQRPPHPTARS